MARTPRVAKKNPLETPNYSKADAYAIKALAAGNASDDQQRRALEFIVVGLCATHDVSMRPGEDGDRLTCFAEGKRYVGLQIEKLVNLSGEILEKLS